MNATRQVGHTPGPWRIYHADGVSVRAKDSGEPGGRLRIAELGRYTSPRVEANARLIAAAPDLLVMLQRILTAMTGGEDFPSDAVMVSDVRAAIAKAEGQ